MIFFISIKFIYVGIFYKNRLKPKAYKINIGQRSKHWIDTANKAQKKPETSSGFFYALKGLE